MILKKYDIEENSELNKNKSFRVFAQVVTTLTSSPAHKSHIRVKQYLKHKLESKISIDAIKSIK